MRHEGKGLSLGDLPGLGIGVLPYRRKMPLGKTIMGG